MNKSPTLESNIGMDAIKIAPNYTVGAWKKLQLDPTKPEHEDWKVAVKILRTRIKKRFLKPVDKLIKLQKKKKKKKKNETYGFTILAIDFLVLETLQGFKDGCESHNRQSKALITKFLKSWELLNENIPEGKNIDEAAGEIYSSYRCALHHSAGTDLSYLIRKSGKIFDFESGTKCVINRTAFHKGLKQDFNNYLKLLLEKDQQCLRVKFKKKMDYICRDKDE